MARKVRPVHCWGIVKRDFIEIKGLGDCRVMSEPRYSCESLDIIQFWIMTPTYKPLLLAMSEESYLNVVEFIDDNDEEFTEEIERIMLCELHKGEKFYFGRRKVKLVERTSFMHFLLQPETSHRQFDMKLMPTMIVKRVKKVHKTKPLSFTEFALSSYERVLGRLAKAVMTLQLDPARVEVQKPVKKAENAPSVITAEDVPSPAPVESESESRNCGHRAFDCDDDDDCECDRSYCVEFDASKITTGTIDPSRVQTERPDSMELKAEPGRPLLCSDVIEELEEVRQHEGDLPVSIVNPEDCFRRVNVSGSMLEDLYECGETYWGSRTWDTQPRPGNPNKSDLVVSLW